MKHINIKATAMMMHKLPQIFGGRKFANSIFFAAALVVAIVASQNIAHAAERRFLIASFNEVVVEGNLNVNIITGKPISVIGNGEHSILSELHFNLVGDKLTVRLSERGRQLVVKAKEPLMINLATKEMKSITINGNSSVKLDKLKAAKARIQIFGSGIVNVDNIETDNLNAIVQGNGNINIASGKGDRAIIILNGAGMINANAFTAQTAEITHSGPAQSRMNVAKTATIMNQGTGIINISGKAQCIIKAGNSGSVSCENPIN
ncbi:hypothetical protein LPB140_11470 [Sphingorhabdus lutea]|uniref:Putative auto-transporter adhesin head GIN domain-containing protein n=1 Tax=Sphingorhabdus lutea TaxID=1913578 RepID=A0A1L3JDV0_9SPHN|nr:DUF2807 domain-containing protein [Sphingorhabdus lutea]APG63300.1 hypothetical protein LPB140_11470 [Sphingorhabdus lutea]